VRTPTRPPCSLATSSSSTRPRQKPGCEWRSRPARERLLARVAQDAERALRAVERVRELAAAELVVEAARLLRELIGQDFEVDEDDVPRLRRGTAKDRILSVHDPEMRHGRKSQSQRFDGYKIHAAASVGARPLLTAIEGSAGCDHDGAIAPTLVDSQPEQLRPSRLLGDTAYGDSETRERLEERRLEVLAPYPSSRRRRERSASASSGSILPPAPSPARPVSGRRSPSGRRHRANGSSASEPPSAAPVRSGRVARHTASARSGSDAAKTSSRPAARRSTTRRQLNASAAPGR
jgi:hypothetical protein